MRKGVFFVLGVILLFSCARQSSESLIKCTDTVYYTQLNNNIKRIHHLMQGAFVAYQKQDTSCWNVADGDSVILYSRPIGNVSKHGYWIYSYEFMTSLPNDPLYVSIKKVIQIERDSFRIEYYSYPEDFTLKKVLNDRYMEENFNFEKAELTPKSVLFVKQDIATFVAQSNIYPDRYEDCLRQNLYTVCPSYYSVQPQFFTLADTVKIEQTRRPNFMVRRGISKKELYDLAAKGFNMNN